MRKLLPLLAVLAFAGGCEGSKQAGPSLDQMRRAFREVPEDTRLAVYWYWISDNISREGVVADLEAMKEAGINRAFIGNIGVGDIPYGPHKVLSEEWWEITHTALRKAAELDIEIGIFNCPGWSQSGGPWVKPGESMRYLASAAMDVQGPAAFSGTLPTPGDKAQDVKVIAYPLPETDHATVSYRVVKSHGNELVVDLTPPAGTTVRTISIQADSPINTSANLYERNGSGYRLVKHIPVERYNYELNVGFVRNPPVVVAVPESETEGYRLVFAADGGAGLEITLSSEPLVERYYEKTLAKMFQAPLPMWHDYMWDTQPEAGPSLAVDPATVVDLTERFADGRLEWDVPEGRWRILRTAMLPTGVTNAPASPDATGLEVDKMSKEHIASHFDAFIGEILRRIPAEDRRTFRVVVEDSYETGGQNWTDDMAERFAEVYGYDPMPFIPVLSGTVVGSRDISDRFLWDLRRLVADRVAYDYVGGLREVSNRHGLTTWLENYGHWGFPGEFLQYGGQSDEIAGEYWSEGTLGDIENRAASSAGHIYGKQKIWAECFTAAGNEFGRYPYLMKQRGDRFFTEGINSVLLHLYIHQPYEDRFPGMNAWFGNEFNRKNTWFGHMNLFTDYLKRTTYILQQGRYIADAAYFIGEDAPKMTGVCDPALPRGYSFDYINAEVLMNHARVKDGKLVLDSGMEYRVLVLPRQATMRPELLERLDRMVREGLAVLGPAPQTSPSLAGYPAADGRVAEMAAGLWDGVGTSSYGRAGKGYVFGPEAGLEQVFEVLDVRPDFTVPTRDNILFIHRAVNGGDIYFVSNQEERPVAFDASFRTACGSPELWDAVTGETRLLPEYTQGDGTVTVPLRLDAYGSCFVVFGGPRGGNGLAGEGAENFPAPRTLATVEGPWTVDFDGLAAPRGPVVFESLTDWTASQDESVKYFSGTATYEAVFEMEDPAGELYLDLGHVMVMGKVWVNGRYAGGVWTRPYRVNVTGLVEEGRNEVRVEVANNWKNRLIGDQNLPESERSTWAPVNTWRATSELQPSGLLGPVRVVAYDYDTFD
ncbi:MAG: glycoside hydrolase family 2 [Alistipes sp.]|nr:glycoside hydrolase family 2 [Alistipes sp.]